MKKTVLIFGLISGAISAAMMFATLPFIDRIGFDKGAIVGYTSIILSFLLVSLASARTAKTSVAERSLSAAPSL